MNTIDTSELLKKRVRAKDGMLVGRITRIEADLESFRITGLRCEASRDILERLALDEPSITGGRTVYIDTTDIAHVGEEVHLKVEALDLAKLNYRKLGSSSAW
jgi:sporulation protein YlmC with PRC-barrel domain